MKKQKYIIIFIIMSLALAICGTLFIRNYAIETPELDSTSLIIANSLQETTEAIIKPSEDPKTEPEIDPEQFTVTDDSVKYKGIVISLGDIKNDVLKLMNNNEIQITLTEEYLLLDTSLCLYFNEDDKCVRLSLLDPIPQTTKGLHNEDTFDNMVNCYGNSYEKTVYTHKGIYEVYRYYNDDYILEFGMEIILDYNNFDATIANSFIIDNVEIYVQEIYPIYNYGPLLEDAWELE